MNEKWMTFRLMIHRGAEAQRLFSLCLCASVIMLCAFMLFVASTNAAMQTPANVPSTDVYLADFSVRGDRVTIGNPVNISKRKGYDNQPGFMPDGQSLLYTVIGEDKQADIYKYVLGTGATTRMTQTTESEYSPTITPDGKYFSVIRVEADLSQRLWKFPLAGGKPELVLETIKPVGYHVWIDAKTLVLFVLGTPNTLQVVDVPTQKAETLATNIGRSLHKIHGNGQVSFVQRVSDSELIIKSLDVQTRKITPLVKMLPGSEYCAWTPTGTLLMATGAKIFKYNPAKDKDWQEVADLSKDGVKGISRIAVSPKGNKIAFVADEN